MTHTVELSMGVKVSSLSRSTRQTADVTPWRDKPAQHDTIGEVFSSHLLAPLYPLSLHLTGGRGEQGQKAGGGMDVSTENALPYLTFGDG